jgi:hypothetical protein
VYPFRGAFLSAAFLVCVSSGSTSALAGDASAVLSRCGPASDDSVQKTTYAPQQRILTYSGLALQFQVDHEDWTFVEASRDGVPITRADAVQSLPCLGDALQEVRARRDAPRTASTDLLNASRARTAARNRIFVWTTSFLLLGGMFLVIRPYTKSVPRTSPSAEKPRSPSRRPNSEGISTRPRRPADPPTFRVQRRTSLEAGSEVTVASPHRDSNT